MKANEFIKKYGIKEAKKVLHCMDDASEFKTYMPGDTWDKPTLIDAVGLRRIVESHELVEKHGGLIESKIYVGCCNYPALSEAIIDVESCHVD